LKFDFFGMLVVVGGGGGDVGTDAGQQYLCSIDASRDFRRRNARLCRSISSRDQQAPLTDCTAEVSRQHAVPKIHQMMMMMNYWQQSEAQNEQATDQRRSARQP
jgi:hypothetical protein